MGCAASTEIAVEGGQLRRKARVFCSAVEAGEAEDAVAAPPQRVGFNPFEAKIDPTYRSRRRDTAQRVYEELYSCTESESSQLCCDTFSLRSCSSSSNASPVTVATTSVPGSPTPHRLSCLASGVPRVIFVESDEPPAPQRPITTELTAHDLEPMIQDDVATQAQDSPRLEPLEGDERECFSCGALTPETQLLHITGCDEVALLPSTACPRSTSATLMMLLGDDYPSFTSTGSLDRSGGLSSTLPRLLRDKGRSPSHREQLAKKRQTASFSD